MGMRTQGIRCSLSPPPLLSFSSSSWAAAWGVNSPVWEPGLKPSMLLTLPPVCTWIQAHTHTNIFDCQSNLFKCILQLKDNGLMTGIESSPPVPGVSGGPGHRCRADPACQQACHALPLLHHSEWLLHCVGWDLKKMIESVQEGFYRCIIKMVPAKLTKSTWIFFLRSKYILRWSPINKTLETFGF